MDREHGPQHEELLRTLQLGEPTARASWQVISACSECQRRLQELDLLEDLLERESGAPERAAEVDRDLDLHARRALLEVVARDAQPRRRWLIAAVCLAAAAVVVAVAWILLGGEGLSPESSPRDQMIGAEAIELLSPDGEVSAWQEALFRWRVELSRGDRLELRLFDATSTEGALPILTVPVDAAGWQPSPAVVASWPDAIRWQVVIRDVAGRVVATATPKTVRLKR